MTQTARLKTDVHHPFHGSALDRSRPLRFRLDGRWIEGFAGDTVLSAAMACGVDTAGLRSGQPVALGLRHAPSIMPVGMGNHPAQALPMERTPAQDGVDYVTLGKRLGSRLLRRLLRRDRHSLGLDLDAVDAMSRPWLGVEGNAGPEVDLVVVGGGIAGMTAAVAGARRGLRVALIEASPLLGGMARLYGTQDGEETPDQSIARLSAAVVQSDTIAVLTGAEAFALQPGMVRLHQVRMEGDRPTGAVLDIATEHVVIATGALERLPVFAGNRLPGVVGAQEAFTLAQLYGVWPGQSALVATSASPAYRLAMLAGDAGIAMARILDIRQQPQSRFIEFSKAYGFTLASGTIVGAARSAPRQRGLAIEPQAALESLSRAEPPVVADRLVVCGGWQPDLTLWHMASGESQWNATTARLEPTTPPPGIVLAGSAAGWFTSRACLLSGTDAVDRLLGGPRTPVDDAVIDPLYETPEAPTPVAAPTDDEDLPAYLDAGRGYLTRPRPAPRRWPAWLPLRPKVAAWSIADLPRPLDLAEIVAGVQLGAIPAASAGIVAHERVAMISMRAEPEQLSSGHLLMPPPYLMDRYPGAGLWVVAPDDHRMLDVGSLIQADADHTDPLDAIGVVVRIVDGTAIALATGTPGQKVNVQQPGHAIAARLVAPYREGMDLERFQ